MRVKETVQIVFTIEVDMTDEWPDNYTAMNQHFTQLKKAFPDKTDHELAVIIVERQWKDDLYKWTEMMSYDFQTVDWIVK